MQLILSIKKFGVISIFTAFNVLALNTFYQSYPIYARYKSFSIAANKGSDNNNNAEKYTKSNLPSKICKVCGRSFDWRKKWHKVWHAILLSL